MKVRGGIRWWHAAMFYALLLVLITVLSHATRSPSAPAAARTLSAPPTTQATARPISPVAGRTPRSRSASVVHQRAQPSPGRSGRTAAAGRLTVVGRGIVLPDRKITPGAVNPAVRQSTIDMTICMPGYTATIRPPSSYTTGLKIEQLDAGYRFHGDTNTGDYEEDHLISLELGGNPRSPKNLWPEPYTSREGAPVKDQIENKLHSLVCAGVISLRTAQRAIAGNWWRAYQHYLSRPATQPSHTRAPPPAAPPPATPPPAHRQHGCTTTSSGTCIRGGEFCPQTDYGITGHDADGSAYLCTGDSTHPHWE